MLPVNWFDGIPRLSLPQVSAPGSPGFGTVWNVQELAGADVVAADVAGRVIERRQRDANARGQPTTTTSRTTMGGGREADSAGLDFRHDRGRARDRQCLLLPKVGMRAAGFRVQRDQLVAGRNERMRSSPVVGPVGEAAIVLANGSALGFVARDTSRAFRQWLRRRRPACGRVPAVK